MFKIVVRPNSDIFNFGGEGESDLSISLVGYSLKSSKLLER